MREFKLVDGYNNELVARGKVLTEENFNIKYDRVIREYDSSCEGDWLPIKLELINGYWVQI